MARIAGVDLARNKRIEIALGYIYGVGRATANKILRDTGVNPDTKVHELTEGDIKKIREYLQTIRVEGDLRRDVTMNIKRLIDIGSYRGLRHKRSLPVRGQRTKTNSRTRKGPRKTVGVMRKEVKAVVDNAAKK
ncbi:MAG: 30S ribosomal protein S13 [Candidatus Firestonebacteria bacterium RIFOXYC2_FULL_39_67]|nr:MAG: 30S ribosomal protein S13 [Candidatus Firestonebacteria bacterium RIFOXYD2_FULL_39_29]OGF57496.1 MAG: 30S ribosomal protein S13 [Candidatus Firestonebacteria bacterium RIFOXYC2_FULL_39_67]OGF57513.1 MAG: 30S ribosomal protein S13 [Candidatus Firestonebacteria bacterium RifOxyC12_full_39_7]